MAAEARELSAPQSARRAMVAQEVQLLAAMVQQSVGQSVETQEPLAAMAAQLLASLA